MSPATARFALFAALLLALPLANAQQNLSAPPAPATLMSMLCTQDGMNKGLKGKELEDFVGKCIKAKRPGVEKKDDAPIADEMANC